MVADSSSHDSATKENNGEGEMRGSAEAGVYLLLQRLNSLQTRTKTKRPSLLISTKLVCDYAVVIVVVCRDIPKLSLVAYVCRC